MISLLELYSSNSYTSHTKFIPHLGFMWRCGFT